MENFRLRSDAGESGSNNQNTVETSQAAKNPKYANDQIAIAVLYDARRCVDEVQLCLR